ncbi:hypothetical protein [Embleya sp. NPDC005971]|uniref:hypothetical protein n=1 Tax=Embleya sp. NPDC005971 TaxID=3156724 RepID=UPI0034014F96
MKKPGILAALTLALVAVLSPFSTAQAAQARAGGECTTTWWLIGGPADATFLCDTDYPKITWPDGRDEYVLIGSDRQVWHSYQYSAGGAWSTWATLGDSNNIQNGVWTWWAGSTPIVQVLGGDNQYWCNVYSGGWSNWHVCT